MNIVFEITPTDANKTNCECSELGSVAVVSELSERFLIPQATECKSSKIIKYIGIAVSVVACLIFILGELILLSEHLTSKITLGFYRR